MICSPLLAKQYFPRQRRPSFTQNQEMFVKKIKQTKQHLRAIISTRIMCGKQIIPLRGHRDGSTSTASNKGNFQKILKNTYFLVGEMLQAPQKLYKRKSFAPLESILVRKLHSRFRSKEDASFSITAAIS